MYMDTVMHVNRTRTLGYSINVLYNIHASLSEDLNTVDLRIKTKHTAIDASKSKSMLISSKRNTRQLIEQCPSIASGWHSMEPQRQQ